MGNGDWVSLTHICSNRTISRIFQTAVARPWMLVRSGLAHEEDAGWAVT